MSDSNRRRTSMVAQHERVDIVVTGIGSPYELQTLHSMLRSKMQERFPKVYCAYRDKKYAALLEYDMRTKEVRSTDINGFIYDCCRVSRTHVACCVTDKKKHQILIIEIESLKVTQTLRGHKDCVSCVIPLSPTLVASSADDRTIRIWNILTGNCEHVINGHSGSVVCLLKVSDTLLASASSDKSVGLWEIPSYNCNSILTNHTKTVWCLEKFNDEIIISGGMDNKICLWDIKEKKLVTTLTDHTDPVYALVKISPTGFASAGTEVRLWKVTGEKHNLHVECVNVFPGWTPTIMCMSLILPYTIAVGSQGVHLINLETGEITQSFKQSGTSWKDGTKICNIFI
jgi:WD40 repeat protein